MDQRKMTPFSLTKNQLVLLIETMEDYAEETLWGWEADDRAEFYELLKVLRAARDGETIVVSEA